MKMTADEILNEFHSTLEKAASEFKNEMDNFCEENEGNENLPSLFFTRFFNKVSQFSYENSLTIPEVFSNDLYRLYAMKSLLKSIETSQSVFQHFEKIVNTPQ